ncbi:type II toxin-antitoxin system RelE/ParE family toxin [Yersinia massiliensis]|uniref:type II toxin-antitoxin system RelE/ParE family toxin n=1 Tax=Yersinia massiliensis TaxID=419257 RepID=UPI001643C5A4|nr:type II toxin-antitoxin system RelE/ParE family toxin [Yersinia massiliensis]
MPQIIIAPAAEWTLKDIESFKSGMMGPVKAAAFVDNLLISSITAISEDPTRYRFNSILSDSGVQFRERLDPDSEYRVIYDYDGQTVEILVFISMKQDLERTLYRYLMFR